MFVVSDRCWSALDRDLSSPGLDHLDSEFVLKKFMAAEKMRRFLDAAASAAVHHQWIIFPIGSSRVTITIGRMGRSQIVIGGRQCSNTRIEFQSKRMVTKALAGLARAQWKLFSVRILYDRAVSALC